MPAARSANLRPEDVFREALLTRLRVDTPIPDDPAAHSLEEFIGTINPYYERAPHAHLLAQHLEAVERGEIRRLIINMPPRHGKSLHVSEYFPAWYLGRNPRKKVILASHTAELAYTASRRNRDHFKDALWPFPKVQLSAAAQAATKWETSVGGECFAVGVGGAIPGHGAHVLIIDDPISGVEDADSILIREKMWKWFISDARPRLQPGGSIILMHTRWNEDDMVGRILNSKGAGDWTVLSLAAICDDPEHDPLGRKEGEPLWPAWYDAEELTSVENEEIDLRGWMAQYQQRPVHEAGNMFHRDWWQEYDPAVLQLMGLKPSFSSVDSSFKDGVENDFSVIATWGVLDGKAYLMDLWRARVQFPQLVDAARNVFGKWRAPLVIEDKASGQSLVQALSQGDMNHPSIPVIPQPIEKNQSKISRAERVTRYVEAKRAYLPKDAPWKLDFVEEHAVFPNGKHDDQVDTTSIALRRIYLGPVRPDQYPSLRYAGAERPTGRTHWRERQQAAKKEQAEEYYRMLEEQELALRGGR